MTDTQTEGASLHGLDLSVWAARWQSKVVEGDGCWGWTGATREGYGRLGTSKGKGIDAHRLSWLIHHGPIPEGLQVLHTCDNPPCSRPDHLFIGTGSDNMQDARAKGRLSLVRVSGDDHPRAKYDSEAMSRITSLRQQGMSQQAIADHLGLSQSHVSKALRGVHRVGEA